MLGTLALAFSKTTCTTNEIVELRKTPEIELLLLKISHKILGYSLNYMIEILVSPLLKLRRFAQTCLIRYLVDQLMSSLFYINLGKFCWEG